MIFLELLVISFFSFTFPIWELGLSFPLLVDLLFMLILSLNFFGGLLNILLVESFFNLELDFDIWFFLIGIILFTLFLGMA